jgi:predicted ATPase
VGSHDVPTDFWLRSIELAGSESLGGDVRLELAERTTVLVGKNGAGKSVLLERLSGAATIVAGIPSFQVAIDPERFACELSDGVHQVSYGYRWVADGRGTDVVARLEESWRDDDQEPRTNPEAGWMINSGNGLGASRAGLLDDFDRRAWARWTRMIDGNSLGSRLSRQQVLVAARGMKHHGRTPIGALIQQLFEWKQTQPDVLDELRAIGHRTQLFDDIHFHELDDPEGKQKFVSADLDGVQIGLLSEGTLRALQIFIALLEPKTRLLLIDEPENAVHPGLLRRLLHEIDAYSEERQIILATQSPQVVSWAHPASIRLVERKDGATTVRSLDAATLRRLDTYLHEGDTLGDFIYGGGIDDAAE